MIFIACDREFEPELKGWKAYTLPGRPIVHLDINGRQKDIELPADDKIGYRFAQWTKLQDQILLTQILKTGSCDNYQIVSVDTTGNITDTIYTAPPNTPVNFKLAPNDSLLLLKTYDDNCEGEGDNFRYTFYNRYSKTSLSDTINVVNARGILLPETIWSPDSKKVIIPAWSGRLVRAFTYDLFTKDTTYIDKGSRFIWSPTDNDMVAYIKDHSIYTKNIKTGEKDVLYQGKKKNSVTDFRWDPNGDFLMIHIRRYILNVAAGPFQQNNIIYFSMKGKTESRVFYDNQRIDTWK